MAEAAVWHGGARFRLEIAPFLHGSYYFLGTSRTMGDYGDGGGARYSEPPGSFFIGIKGRCPLRLINRPYAQCQFE